MTLLAMTEQILIMTTSMIFAWKIIIILEGCVRLDL